MADVVNHSNELIALCEERSSQWVKDNIRDPSPQDFISALSLAMIGAGIALDLELKISREEK